MTSQVVLTPSVQLNGSRKHVDWREYVQNRFEQVGVAHNRVSLLMGARPAGRDAHYPNPPPEELAAEYMKAAGQLRVYPLLTVKG